MKHSTTIKQSWCCGIFAFLLVLTACSGSPKKHVKTKHPHSVSGPVYQQGLASWYGKAFQGKKTASGERFNMYAMTAAHRTLPFGTILDVTYLKTNRRVRVRVNDRGPFARGRIVDLSFNAAKKIGLIAAGHGEVKIRVVAQP